MMDLVLEFKNGAITGDGADGIGSFVISGNYSTQSGECSWMKQYVGRHAVDYKGFREGKGIWGNWALTSGSGGFHIWPLSEGIPPESAEEADEKPEPALAHSCQHDGFQTETSRTYWSQAVIWRLKIMALFLACLAYGLAGADAGIPPQKPIWEPEIRAFEKKDQLQPPPQNAILFVGSSSIRKWTTLTNDFPGLQVINRGFGGSQIDDSTAFSSRIIFPYHPRIIVFYAGDNDLALGKSPDQVVAEYTNFVGVVHAQLAQTRIVFISIKPSLARWNLRDQIVETNRRIAAMKEPYLSFVDIYPSMLGSDGKPEKDLLLEDGLHPSEKCYQLWASLIRPYLN